MIHRVLHYCLWNKKPIFIPGIGKLILERHSSILSNNTIQPPKYDIKLQKKTGSNAELIAIWQGFEPKKTKGEIQNEFEKYCDKLISQIDKKGDADFTSHIEISKKNKTYSVHTSDTFTSMLNQFDLPKLSLKKVKSVPVGTTANVSKKENLQSPKKVVTKAQTKKDKPVLAASSAIASKKITPLKETPISNEDEVIVKKKHALPFWLSALCMLLLIFLLGQYLWTNLKTDHGQENDTSQMELSTSAVVPSEEDINDTDLVAEITNASEAANSDIVEEKVIEPVKTTKEQPTKQVETTQKVEPNKTSKPKELKENVSFTGNEPGFYIVVGAFGVQKNAEKLAQKLRANNYSSTVLNTGGKLVKVGVYAGTDGQNAKQELEKLKSNGYPTSWIMKK